MKSKKFLAMVMAATLTFGMVAFSGCRDNDKDKATAQTPTESVQVANDNMTMTEQGGNGIQMLSVVITPDKYADYGVSENAESAHLVTASYPEGEYVSNTAVDWYVEFVNADSEWATGKKASDYVTVTPTSDGALTAVVEGLKAFGEQIRVVCASRQSPDKSDSFICDYKSVAKTVALEFDCSLFPTLHTSTVEKPVMESTDVHFWESADNPEFYAVTFAESHLEGIHSVSAKATDWTLGTWHADEEYLCIEYCFPMINEFYALAQENNILTFRDDLEFSSGGNLLTNINLLEEDLGMPLALMGTQWLKEADRMAIAYYWANQHYGTEIPDAWDTETDKTVYSEYLRIMNELISYTEGDEPRHMYGFSIGVVSADMWTEYDEGVTAHGYYDYPFEFYLENPAEYFKAEASSLTLDTDHILFEP